LFEKKIMWGLFENSAVGIEKRVLLGLFDNRVLWGLFDNRVMGFFEVPWRDFFFFYLKQRT